MTSVHDFVIAPKGERYNNTKKLDGGELILNTEIFNHQFVKGGSYSCFYAYGWSC